MKATKGQAELAAWNEKKDAEDTREQDRKSGMMRIGVRRSALPFYSIFVGLVFCDSVQIRLNVAIQNEVCIGQRVVVDEIVQLRPLEAVVRHLVLHGGGSR